MNSGHLLAPAVSCPEEIGADDDNEGHYSEADQAEVVQAYRRIAVRVQIENQAVEGEDALDGVGDSLLRPDDHLDDVRPFEVDRGDGRDDLEVVQEDLNEHLIERSP